MVGSEVDGCSVVIILSRCVLQKWDVRGAGLELDSTSDMRPLYFITTSEPRTPQRMCENVGKALAFLNGREE